MTIDVSHRRLRLLVGLFLLLLLAVRVAVAAPLLITDVQRQAETVQLTWNSQTGKVYAIEYSSDLKSWERFATNVAASAGASTAVNLSTADPVAGNDFVLLQYQMGSAG